MDGLQRSQRKAERVGCRQFDTLSQLERCNHERCRERAKLECAERVGLRAFYQSSDMSKCQGGWGNGGIVKYHLKCDDRQLRWHRLCSGGQKGGCRRRCSRRESCKLV